jgi:hypothetical protein
MIGSPDDAPLGGNQNGNINSWGVAASERNKPKWAIIFHLKGLSLIHLQHRLIDDRLFPLWFLPLE